jgi:hypothetical protein
MAINFLNTVAVDESVLFVDTVNDRVGIGTASPSRKLVVSGAADGIIQSNDTTGDGSHLRMLADVTAQNVINWDKDTALRFATSDEDWANYSERMRITSGGELIINGTTSAYGVSQGYPLHVKGTSSQGYVSICRGTQNSGSEGLIVGTDSSNAYLLSRDNINLVLGTNNLSHVFIKPSGNVGIGTTLPQSKLQVAGGIQMADDTDAASATKVGTMRYRTGTEYVEVTGTELITNGDFEDGEANWNGGQTSPATVTFSNGKMTIVSPNGESAYRQQSILTPTKTYKATVDVVVRSGTCKLQWGTGTGATTSTISATGSYVFYKTIPATGADALFYCARKGACDVDFDNVSVMEVTAEDASYADMCMQTGSSTYEWVNIVRNTY